MPIVRMPDGTQVRFPDDMPPEQIRSLIQQKFPETAPSPAPAAEPPVKPASIDWNGPFKNAPVPAQEAESPLARAARLALQAAGRGAADVAAAPVDVPVGLVNIGAAGINDAGRLFGNPDLVPYASVPGLNGETAGGALAEKAGQIADLFGFNRIPEDQQTPQERLIGKVAELGSAGAISGGAGALVAPTREAAIAGGKEAPSIVNSFLRPYLERPGAAIARDTGAGAGAAVGQEVTSKYTNDPLVNALGALAGGVGGAGVVEGTAALPRGVRAAYERAVPDKNVPLNPKTGRPYSKAEADLAARAMQGAASDAETAGDNIATNAADLRAAGTPEAAIPTSAMLSRDTGLNTLERSFRNQEGPQFINRDQAVKGKAAADVANLRDPNADQSAVPARAQAVVDQKVQPFRQAVNDAERAQAEASAARQAEGAPIAVRAGSDNAAEASRRLDTAVVDQGYTPARAAKNALFQSEGAGQTIDLTDLKAHAQQILDQRKDLPPSQRGDTRLLEDLTGTKPTEGTATDMPAGAEATAEPIVPDQIPYEAAGQLRIQLSTEIAKARATGDFAQADMLRGLRRTLSDSLDEVAPEAARNYRENFAPKYRPGPGDEAAKFTAAVDRDATRTSTPPEATAGRFLTAPEKSAALDRILKDTPGEAQGRSAVRDYLMSDFAKTALNPDGSVNPARAQAWLQNNASVLESFGAIRSEFDGIAARAASGEAQSAAAARALDAARSDLRRAESDVSTSAVGKLLGEDPRDVAEGLLSGKWSADKKIDEINAALKGDSDAQAGWKAAFADVLANRVTNTKAGVPGEYEVSFAKLAQQFKENEDLLTKVFNPEEMSTLRQAHKLLGYFKEAEKRANSGSDTAEKMLMMSKGDAIMGGPLGRSIELALKHVYGNLEGGGMVRRFRLMVSLLPTSRYGAREIVQMAWFNPDLAAYLLGKPVRNLNSIPTNHGLRTAIAADLSQQGNSNDNGSTEITVTRGTYNDKKENPQ